MNDPTPDEEQLADAPPADAVERIKDAVRKESERNR